MIRVHSWLQPDAFSTSSEFLLKSKKSKINNKMSFPSLICFCIFGLLAVGNNAAPHKVRASAPRSFFSTAGKSDRSFSITQVKNTKFVPQYVPTAEVYASPFLKHHMRMPAPLNTVLSELQANGTDAVLKARVAGNAISTTNGFYVFPVSVGTPSQSMNMFFDTGSGDFWVWSWLMPAYMLTGRNYYNATTSTSAQRWLGQWYSATYGGGSTYGLVYTDTVWVDSGRGSFGVSGNPIECSQNVANGLVSMTGVDGMLGLSNAFNDSESPVPQQTWTTYILPHLSSPVFTVSFTQGDYHLGVATVDFGYIDSAKYVGNIAYTPVTIIPGTTGGYWAANLTGLAIGNAPFQHINIQVMTDTGGQISMLPASMTAKFYSQVTGSYTLSDGSYAYPCTSTLPNIIIGVGSGRVVIRGSHMTYGPMSNGDCYGGLQTTSDSYIYFTLAFMQSIFIVHDYGNMQMGFANRTNY